MPSLVIVDSGPLIAAFNTLDDDHRACSALLRRTDLEFAVPALCIGEAAHVIGSRTGWRAEAAFLDAVAHLDVRLPEPVDWSAIAREVERYADFDIGAADASVIVLAEKLQTSLIATLDHRHFRAIRPRHITAFTLLPEL